MEEKKVVHLGVTGVLLIIAIIVIAIEGVFIWKMNKEKDDKEQEVVSLQQRVNSLNVQVSELQGKLNKISGVINSDGNDNTNNESIPTNVQKAFSDKMNAMPYYDETTELEKSDSFDIDGDGSKEYIYITNYYGENNIHIYDSNGNYMDAGIADGGGIKNFEIREKNGQNILYVVTFMADGLCYQAENDYALELKNGVFEKTNIASYSCDDEEEMKIRSALEHKDGSAMTEEEERQYYLAHTLKYESNGKRISKSEFENIINDFKSEYKLVKIIK